jgi:hypothetical protein
VPATPAVTEKSFVLTRYGSLEVPEPVVDTDTVKFAEDKGVPVVVLLYVPLPAELIARTLTVYEVPLVSPVNVYDVLVLFVLTVLADPPLGVYSTVYPVIGVDPTYAGAVQVNANDWFDGVADNPVGAFGGANTSPQSMISTATVKVFALSL